MSHNTNMIWISAGELSGDIHGASLMRELLALDPTYTFTGMGGPHMALEANFSPLFRIEELSVMGFTEVVSQLPRILILLRRIKQALAKEKPRALIVIDAPSFHFRVIKAARALGIPIYYYIGPKAWAWNEKRAIFIKDNVQRLISILPFEVPFYKRFGMDIEYVGNPLVDLVDWETIKHITPVPGKIGLLPGSRKREIESLLPEFGAAAKILQNSLPNLSFHVIPAPGINEEMFQELWPAEVPLTISPPADRYAFMRSCELLIAASGTVTLEAALVETPTLVTYKVSKITYAVGKAFLKVPYISLPNLILNKKVFPELLQKECDGSSLAAHALQLLLSEGGNRLAEMRNDLSAIRSRLGTPGATRRAAEIIRNDLENTRSPLPQVT